MDIFSPRRRALCKCLLTLVLFSFRAIAAETDNFYLPLKPEFADLGDYFQAVHTRAIVAGVREVNSRIERALNTKDEAARARQLALCHTPDAIAAAVASQFGDAPTETSRIERAVSGTWARRTFPDKSLVHSDISMNFRGHFILDPGALFCLAQAGTVQAFGVYFGTDKLLHFHQLGHPYYKRYRAQLQAGSSPEEARREVVKYFSSEALFAEGNLFGAATTHIYSNADLAANYLGFKFFLNLTETVVLLGQAREPLVVRCGVFWRVNDQVRPQSGWFRPFISDHWNEALNPSLYSSSMRPRIRKILQSRAANIVQFYTENDGRPENPEYFNHLEHRLATYGGEPYGHSGHFENLMDIGNTCLSALPAKPTPSPERLANVRR